MAGGLEQGGWGLGGCLRAWGLGPGGGRGSGGGLEPGDYPPLFYRTSSPSGPLPKRAVGLKDVGLVSNPQWENDDQIESQIHSFFANITK